MLASEAWTNGVRGIRGVGSPTKVDFWSVLAYTAWTNQLRGVLGGSSWFGSVRAGIEVGAIFTDLKYVKIVPLGRFAQCYCSIFFQFALGIYVTG